MKIKKNISVRTLVSTVNKSQRFVEGILSDTHLTERDKLFLIEKIIDDCKSISNKIKKRMSTVSAQDELDQIKIPNLDKI